MKYSDDLKLTKAQFQLLNFNDCSGIFSTILSTNLPQGYRGIPDAISDYINAEFYDQYDYILVTSRNNMYGCKSMIQELIQVNGKNLYHQAQIVLKFASEKYQEK